MRKVLFIVLPCLALLFVIYRSYRNEAVPADFDDITSERHTPDSLFEKHKDSLGRYFGPLEQDLLRNYKNSREQMNTEADFYAFYRNTHTLKNSLKRTLQVHVKDYMEQGMTDFPDFQWFRQVANGLVVADVNNADECDIFYDYDILLKYAEKTTGKADDEYTRLIRLCFEDNHYYPVWAMTYPDKPDATCSRLGSGKHYIAMRQLLIAQASGDLFKRELASVKQILYQDIFFRKEYCYSSKLAIKELQNIIHKLELKSHDKTLFQVRIKQIEEAERYGLQFDCQNGACKNEQNKRPDV